MKKILQTIIATSLLFLFGTANAQIDGNNNIAPNFQGFDINGNAHDFYADYLDHNMPIILDVSAHWCSPCWSYHNTHAMRDLFDQYGPNGSVDDSTCMVFFADGDANSTFAELHNIGLVGNQSTQGDWVTGTTYPIFGGDTGIGANHGRDIANLYQINYFPTVFLIHPDRTVEEIGALNFNGLLNAVQGANPVPTTTNDAQLKYVKPIPYMCPGNNVTADFVVKNLGDSTMTSATIEVKLNGVVQQTINWTGSLDKYQIDEESLTLTQVPVGNHTLEIDIVDVNGGVDENTSNNVYSSTFAIGSSEDSTFTMTVSTDSYGSETGWTLKNSSNQIVYRNSDFVNSYGNSQTYTHNLILSENDCYELTVTDSYGDGMDLGGNNPGITIKDANNNIVALSPATFENQVSGGNFEKYMEVIVDTTTNISEKIQKSQLSIYPNPVKDNVNIDLNLFVSSNVKINIVNSLGELVASENYGNLLGENTLELNVENLSKGIYMLNIVVDNEVLTHRLIK